MYILSIYLQELSINLSPQLCSKSISSQGLDDEYSGSLNFLELVLNYVN